MAEAAAQGEATDPRRGDDPARRREPVLVRCSVDVAPGAAAADPNRARLRIDLDVAQQREIDHDTVVAGSQPSAVVAAAADRKRQVVVASEPHSRRHVVGVRTAGDQRRPSVDHGVEDLARFAVLGILGPDQRSVESAQLFTCGACGCGPSAHSVLLIRVCCCRECFSSKPVIRPNGTAGSGVRRGERRLGRAMRSADPLPLNSRNAPPTAFATPPGLRRIGENEPPSGWDSKLVVAVRECYRWSLHCSFLARPCCAV